MYVMPLCRVQYQDKVLAYYAKKPLGFLVVVMTKRWCLMKTPSIFVKILKNLFCVESKQHFSAIVAWYMYILVWNVKDLWKIFKFYWEDFGSFTFIKNGVSNTRKTYFDYNYMNNLLQFWNMLEFDLWNMMLCDIVPHWLAAYLVLIYWFYSFKTIFSLIF